MAAANDALAQEDPKSHDIEELTDPEGEHIEMVRPFRPALPQPYTTTGGSEPGVLEGKPANPNPQTLPLALTLYRTWRVAFWRASRLRRRTSRSSRSTRPASSANWRTHRQASRPPSSSFRCPRDRRQLWRELRRLASMAKD
jgi:hypothetical protein